MKRLTAILLLLALLLCGCAPGSADLTQGITPDPVEDAGQSGLDAMDFAVSLFQNSVTKGENTLISPLSVLSALAMTANGAEGETLTQMEQVLGGTRADLNAWTHSYLEGLEESDALTLANAIWFNENAHFEVAEDFLQTNADYFGAGLFAAPFDDATLKDINGWVKKNTDGTIDSILDQISADAVMYLVNALAFDAKWAEPYREDQIREGTFNTGDGRRQAVEMMYSSVWDYLENDLATGFIRYYEGNDYAFVALLPKAGITVPKLVESLDGDTLTALLAQPQDVEVRTALPKFEAETSLELSEILKAVGMTDAFEFGKADFTGMGSGELFISRVLHKTFISVDAQGTKAGAATAVEVNYGAAIPTEEIKQVYLDRPFVYMLVDCENGLPFFMGTCMEMEGVK